MQQNHKYKLASLTGWLLLGLGFILANHPACGYGAVGIMLIGAGGALLLQYSDPEKDEAGEKQAQK